MELRPGALLGGKYRLVRFLGEGSQAVVWEAEYSGIHGFSRRVVLKIVQPSSLKIGSFREMLLHEARIAANLRHPNIVEFYDIDEDRELLFIAMEYIEGWELQTILLQSLYYRKQALPWFIAAHLMRSVCDGLFHAHHFRSPDGQLLSLIHRDIKPNNILVTRAGQAKLIDFGVAKSSLSASRTKTGVIKGTPAYMAPEQALGKPVDNRTDLFSLGATLYELCAGEGPFFVEESDHGFVATLMKIILEPHVSLDAKALGLPVALVALIDRLLAKHPVERPPDAQAVKQTLDRILEDAGIDITDADVSQFLVELMSLGAQEHLLDQWTIASADMFEDASFDDLEGQIPTGILVRTPRDQTIQQARWDVPTRQIDMQPPIATGPQPGAHALESPQTTPPVTPTPSASRGLAVIAGAAVLLLLLLGGWWSRGLWLGLLGHQSRVDTGASASPTAIRPSGLPRSSAGQEAGSSEEPTILPPMRPPDRRQGAVPVAPKQRNPTTPPPQPRKVVTSRQMRRKKAIRRRRRVSMLRRAPRAPRAVASGFVLFDITPRCRLFVKGTFVGVAQALLLRKPPGLYRFRCLHPPDRLLRFFDVRIRSGQSTRIQKTFRRGKLFVLSFPWADIYLPPFGKIGRSQALISLPEGRHRVLLYKMGNEQTQKRITVVIKPGKITRPLVRW